MGVGGKKINMRAWLCKHAHACRRAAAAHHKEGAGYA